MRFLSFDLASETSSNMTFTFEGGGSMVTSIYAGDTISHVYRLRAAANHAANSKVIVASVVDDFTGTQGWTDANVVNQYTARYYDIATSLGGAGYTNAQEWAFYVQDRTSATNYKYLVSVPVDHGTNNTLNSTLGQQLARGLEAGSAQGNSDQLWYRRSNDTWQVFWLQDTGGGATSWRKADNTAADLTVTAGMGFWVFRSAPDARTTPPSTRCRGHCAQTGLSATTAAAPASPAMRSCLVRSDRTTSGPSPCRRPTATRNASGVSAHAA